MADRWLQKVANDEEHAKKSFQEKVPKTFNVCLKPLYNKKKKVESILLKNNPWDITGP